MQASVEVRGHLEGCKMRVVHVVVTDDAFALLLYPKATLAAIVHYVCLESATRRKCTRSDEQMMKNKEDKQKMT